MTPLACINNLFWPDLFTPCSLKTSSYSLNRQLAMMRFVVGSRLLLASFSWFCRNSSFPFHGSLVTNLSPLKVTVFAKSASLVSFLSKSTSFPSSEKKTFPDRETALRTELKKVAAEPSGLPTRHFKGPDKNQLYLLLTALSLLPYWTTKTRMWRTCKRDKNQSEH